MSTPPVMISFLSTTPAVTDVALTTMVHVLAIQLARDVAPFWGPVPALEAVHKGSKPTGDATMTISAVPDAPDALGYHIEDRSGRARGKVFTDPTLKNGGTVLLGSNSVAQTASHELLEMTGDGPANRWVDGPGGVDFALELCLAGDTLVRLADGSDVSIQALADRGGFFSVRACYAAGQVIAARAGHARLTARQAETLRVTFRDGSFVRCTPGHKVLMADGSFLAAGTLKSGMILRKDMSPRTPLENPVNCRRAKAILFRENESVFGRCSDSDDIACGQSRSVMQFPSKGTCTGTHPLFCRSVKHILVMGSEKQVVGTDAGGGIAAMADRLASGDLSRGHFVGETVRKDGLPLFSNLTVARAAFGTNPDPAVRRLLNARPEASLQCRTANIVGLSPKTSGGGRSVPFYPHPVRAAESLSEQFSSTSLNCAFHAKIVDTVEADARCDVYDLTVPGLRNFALTAGVFVHNCDAVEGDSYEIEGVSVSNFVLPAFFDPQASKGSRFDRLGKLSAPFTMTPGGYQITRTEPGKVAQIFAQIFGTLIDTHHAATDARGREIHVHFGPDFPEHRKAAIKARAAARRG